MIKYFVISKKIWDKKYISLLSKNIKFEKKIVFSKIKKSRPKIIFFIHWSKKIPKKIYNKYLCIQFHSSNLPYGRGGSPIQNQILKGREKTYLCAFRVTGKIDSGKIYLKKILSLKGSAHEIYCRMEKLSIKIIKLIIKNKKIVPKKQTGVVKYFKRRTERDSNMTIYDFKNLKEAYNFIRMLDAKNYPKANFKLGKLKFEFYNVKNKKNKLIANTLIKYEN